MKTTQAIDERAALVLAFWLGDAPAATEAAGLKRWVARWFSRDEALDDRIRGDFAGLAEAALRGDLDGWAATPRERLALVILLDQFPRNLYRDSPRAFAGDAKARWLADDAIRLGQDQALAPVERTFFYLPFEHAEDLAAQEQAVALFDALRTDAPPGLSGAFSSFHDYALRHRDVIARFGRFPHRNAVLGRESTDAEREYLAQPGSGF